MSKYIIDIPDNVKKIVYFHLGNANAVWTTSNDLDDLEQLNSDYINEHYGDLQDTAYQKGFEDGKKEAESSEAIEQAKVDAFNKGMLFKEEKINDAFKRGFEKGKAVNDKGCEGCKYANVAGTHEPCVRCSNSYGNQWTAKDDKIGVGDVVKTYNGITYVVTKTTTDGIVVGFGGKGNTCGFALDEVTKTGEHYNINEILGGLCDD